jgi:hypothetical protein
MKDREFAAIAGGLIYLEDDASTDRHQYRRDNSCHRLLDEPGVIRRRELWLQAAGDAGKETQMKRILRLTVALLLGVAVVSPILGASQASACHYTSQDRAKGYKC